MSSVPIIKFLFRNDWKVLTEALNLNPIYESVELGSANDLSTYLSSSGGGLVVTSLRDKNDLIQLASFVKMFKRVQNAPYIKIFVINFSHDKQFEKAISKLGILDIIDDKIQTKALRFKVDFMMKSVNAQVKKQQANAPTSTAVKSGEASKAQDKKISENTPIWENPLDCEDDVWLLKAEQDCKKVLTRWLVKLMGPSPYVAQWVESGTSGIWKFEFKGENVFIYGAGHWYYRGDQKPDFIWSENIWSFTGSSFELFYKEGDVVTSRLKLSDKVLRIAKNSDFAKTKEQSIMESFDKELVFKKGGMAAGEAEAFDKEQEKYQNLEGKGKTDSLKGGPLSGKGSTSHLNSDPLSMDLEPGENNSSSDPLSQKANSSKTSSFWKGKNEYAEEGKADLSAPTDQATKTGAELSLENKNKHEKYYKNHNEAEQFEGKETGHAIKKDGVADNLKGKTATDEIEGHLTSPDAKKEKVAKDKAAAEMSGKSATDKLPGHLTSPDAKKEEGPAKDRAAAVAIADEMNAKPAKDKLPGQSPAADAKKEEPSAKDKTAAEMSGKSATDKLPGHLSSPDAKKEEALAKEKAAAEMSGKSATDKLPGHLASPEAKKAEALAKEKAAAAELSGKSATDKLPGNLSSPEAKKAEAQAKEKAAAAEMSGKSATDKLPGHLSSPEAKKEETLAKEKAAAAELSGKSATDKLPGNLSSPESKKDAVNKDKNAPEIEGKQDTSEAKDKKKTPLESPFHQDKDQDLKEGLNSFNKSLVDGNKRESETDQDGGHYSNWQVPRKDKDSPAPAGNNKVLPFTGAKKDSVKAEEEEVLPIGIAEAIMEAKVTSYLVQDSLKVQCRLDDHFDQTIIFVTDQQGLQSSKNVMLNLNFNYMNKDTNLRFSGNIKQVDSDGEGSNYVTVEISKENVNAFNSFMKLYSTRQNNINLFLKTAKGF